MTSDPLTVRLQNCVVTGDVPLAELAGYSKDLRTLTSGRANINMQLSHYQVNRSADLHNAMYITYAI